MKLSDGRLLGRKGSNRGRSMTLGPSARIRVGGIDVVAISIRQQCTDPAILEHFGIDVGALRGFVVKSRGHFRAGFDDFFRNDQIVEVDAPGLATQRLESLPYRHIRRPLFPLDRDMTWTP
jgi:microcystin degradation protein MlrC